MTSNVQKSEYTKMIAKQKKISELMDEHGPDTMQNWVDQYLKARQPTISQAQDVVDPAVNRTFPHSEATQQIREKNKQIPDTTLGGLLGDDLVNPNANIQIPLIRNLQNNKTPNIVDPNQLTLTQNTNPVDKTKAINKQPDIIKKQEPSPKIQDNVSIQQPTSFEDQMLAARDQDAQQQLLFGLLKAAQMGGKALSMTEGKADTSYADEGLKDKNQYATALKTNMDMESQHKTMLEKEKMRDPNSDISKQTYSLFARVFPELAKKYTNMSAAQFQELGINVGTLMKSEQDRKTAEVENRIRTQERKDIQKEKEELKQAQSDIKRITDVNKLASLTLQRKSTPAGAAQENLRVIENVEALLNGSKNLDDLDSRQVREAVRVLDRTLSGGTATVSGTEHLTPETYLAKLQKHLEKLTNAPRGANQGEFVKRIQETFTREKEKAKEQIFKTQKEIYASVSDIAKRDPESLRSSLLSHELSTDIDTDGLVQQITGIKQPTKKHDEQKITRNLNNNKGKPKTVIQNGYTYTLNEATGKYE